MISIYETIVIDVETWNSKSFAFGVVWFSFNEYEVFTDPEIMRDFIISLSTPNDNARPIRILGHNIAYDLSWIFGNPEIFFSPEYKKDKNDKKRFWKDILARGGKFYFAKYHNLRFEDTFNIFPMSLSKAGEVVGYPKLITPEKFLNNKITYLTDEDVKYCVRDCEVTFLIYQKMKEFVEMNGGELKLTLASSSMSIIKNTIPVIKDYTKKLSVDYNFKNMDEHFRNSYYGGRTEVFRTEIQNGNYYDINSLYPYVLQNEDFKYPDPMTYRWYKGTLENVLYSHEGCCYVRFKVPYMDIPLLPIRDPELKKLVYGFGNIEGYYNFPEIRKALELGYQIISASEIVIADPIISPLKPYITEMYKQRLDMKKIRSPEEKIIKLFLNSAYGKFAQRTGGSKYIPMNQTDLGGKVVKKGGINYIITESPLQRSYCDIVSIASYTTTYARLTLYSYLEKCDNVTYCDTDSIITTSELPTSDRIGDMKLEGKIIYGSFKGRKDYYVEMEDETLIKRKGVSVKNILSIDGKKISGDNINDYLLDIHKADVLHFTKIIKSREGIIRELDSGHSTITKKERKYKNDSGRIFQDGISKPMEVVI